MSERLRLLEELPPQPVTLYELGVHRMVQSGRYQAGAVPERLNGADFAAVGLPIYGGCEVCEAAVAAYNACPSQTGYLRCVNCIDDQGYSDVVTADFALFGLGDESA